jgi:hypothetical protein
MNYTDEMQSALERMEDAGRRGLLISGRTEIFGNKLAFWTFLKNIEYPIPALFEFDPSKWADETFQLPNDLGQYISEICDGNIDLAIDVIDQIIRDQITLNVLKGDESRLQLLTTYLRSVSSVITRYRKRKDKVHREPPKLNVPELFYEKYLPNWTKFSIRPSVHLNINVNHGYCDLCYRVCKNSNRCWLHIKTKETENEVKNIERSFKGAFQKLGLRSTFYRSSMFYPDTDTDADRYKSLDSDAKSFYSLKKGDLSKNKRQKLYAWADKHPLHRNYAKEIQILAYNYFDPHLLSDVNNSMFEFLKEAAFVGLDYSHMNLKIQPFGNIKEQYIELFEVPFMHIGVTDNNSIYVNKNSTVFAMLYRISIFSLIELAYRGKELDTSHL